MNPYIWYDTLLKPLWAPPAWIFAPVWAVLDIVIIISFGAVFYDVYLKKLPFNIIWPFILNIIFTILFTPLFLGTRNNLLAGLDIIFVLTTLIWCMIVIGQEKRWVVYINIPYFLWVMLVATLQLSITILNF